MSLSYAKNRFLSANIDSTVVANIYFQMVYKLVNIYNQNIGCALRKYCFFLAASLYYIQVFHAESKAIWLPKNLLTSDMPKK